MFSIKRCGEILRTAFFYLLSYLFGVCWLFVAASYADVSRLIKQAAELELSKEAQWLALLHYDPSLLSKKSLVDDPDFFFSPRGKHDPKSELEHTLQAFVASIDPANPDDHPLCRFQARRKWLERALGHKFAEIECVRFEQWKSALDVRGATLIFPSSFLNNPASAFGHTLLRLDSSDGSPLLSYAVNYSAYTGDDLAVVYALKGLFGGYYGFFSISPYYEMVKKYSDIEARDIWEYPLDLSEDELDLLVRHIWELRGVYFNYFYFDENCSYLLLSLLDAAAPDANLTGSYSWWHIPSDTVRTVRSSRLGTPERVFRPSAQTLLIARGSAATKPQRDLAVKLASGEVSVLELEDSIDNLRANAEAVDLAYELVSFKMLSKKANREVLEPLALELLTVRSTLPSQPEIKPEEPALSPDEGHRTSRLTLEIGREVGQEYLEYRYRAAYHDLLDPPGGYQRGSGIGIFDLRVRRHERRGFSFEQLNLLDVSSFPEQHALIRPLSWSLNADLKRKPLSKSEESAIFGHLEGGVGRTNKISDNAFIYGLGTITLGLSGRYQDSFALAPGVKLGSLYYPTDKLAFELSAQGFVWSIGESSWEGIVKAEGRWHFSTSASMYLKASQQREGRTDGQVFAGGIHWYL